MARSDDGELYLEIEGATEEELQRGLTCARAGPLASRRSASSGRTQGEAASTSGRFPDAADATSASRP